jgi:hypothetical protein
LFASNCFLKLKTQTANPTQLELLPRTPNLNCKAGQAMEKGVDGGLRSMVFPFFRTRTRRTHTVFAHFSTVFPIEKAVEKGRGLGEKKSGKPPNPIGKADQFRPSPKAFKILIKKALERGWGEAIKRRHAAKKISKILTQTRQPEAPASGTQ